MGPLVRLLALVLVAFAVYQTLRGWRLTRRPEPPTVGPQAIQDMTQCPTCRTFVLTGAGRCARPDCPRR